MKGLTRRDTAKSNQAKNHNQFASDLPEAQPYDPSKKGANNLLEKGRSEVTGLSDVSKA